MDRKTKIAIVGFGNIGRGVLGAVDKNNKIYGDMEIAGIITRDPIRVIRSFGGSPIFPVYSADNPVQWKSLEADVAILCGGSKNDLPVQGPVFARTFNTVDSFDTHANIPEYFAHMNAQAIIGQNVSVISAGWDPGTFSLERVLGDAFIPGATPQATYGLGETGGLSMGHSDAVRKISGVKDARQYTHATPESIEAMKKGEGKNLTAGDKMWRECFVVLEDDTPEEKARVESRIKTMPNYFAPYRTTVDFTTQKELDEKHSGMPHDGLVLTVGETGSGNSATIQYKNEWGSNPEATGNILVACARAAHRLNLEGKTGAITMLDIPPAKYSPHSREELLRDFM